MINNTKDEMVLSSIQELENTIQDYIVQGESVEEISSLIMYKVLLFALSGIPNNTNILHRKCWEYYEDNKQKLISTIP